MITGNGLIANALRDTFEKDESVILFARGVSNSSCEDDSAYAREIDMIKSFSSLATNKIFIYFSTTSVFDSEKQHTKYVQTKLKFELEIQTLFPKSIIIRLPIIVGKTNNENQLFGYLLKAIKNRQPIQVHKHAGRYLIDVADLPIIVKSVVDYYKHDVLNGNFTIDICGNQPIPINEIILMLSKAIGIEPELKIVESGSTYFIDNTPVRSILNEAILNKNFQHVFNEYYS